MLPMPPTRSSLTLPPPPPHDCADVTAFPPPTTTRPLTVAAAVCGGGELSWRPPPPPSLLWRRTARVRVQYTHTRTRSLHRRQTLSLARSPVHIRRRPLTATSRPSPRLLLLTHPSSYTGRRSHISERARTHNAQRTWATYARTFGRRRLAIVLFMFAIPLCLTPSHRHHKHRTTHEADAVGTRCNDAVAFTLPRCSRLPGSHAGAAVRGMASPECVSVFVLGLVNAVKL